MTIQQFIDPCQAVYQAAAALVMWEYLDREHAQQLGPLAEAVANMFMVMFCQAETGQVLKGGSKRPSRPCGSL